jgi:very-short-patch-repair endonuclease
MISTGQALAVGLSYGEIRHRVGAGQWVRKTKGVYRVGPIEPPLGAEAAALLACPCAVLASFSAAAIWGIAERPDVVHLLSPSQRRNRAGLIVHRGAVEARDVTRRQNLTLTSPYRTLGELRRHASATAYARAIKEAAYRRLITDAQTRSLLGDAPTAAHESERRLVDLIAKARLPPPKTNRKVHGFEVDLYWPDHGIVVEVDGFQAHGHRQAFEDDRRKDLALRAAGLTVVRVTWRQITEEPEALVAALARLLSPTAGATRPAGRSAGPA